MPGGGGLPKARDGPIIKHYFRILYFHSGKLLSCQNGASTTCRTEKDVSKMVRDDESGRDASCMMRRASKSRKLFGQAAVSNRAPSLFPFVMGDHNDRGRCNLPHRLPARLGVFPHFSPPNGFIIPSCRRRRSRGSPAPLLNPLKTSVAAGLVGSWQESI